MYALYAVIQMLTAKLEAQFLIIYSTYPSGEVQAAKFAESLTIGVNHH